MASLTITTRQTASGPRYVVRYRLGGRAYPIEHGGSFRTLREAKGRRDLIGGELAAGRDPREALRALTAAPVPVFTFSAWAERYRASRVDVSSGSQRTLGIHIKALNAVFGERDPRALSVEEITEWIGGAKHKPSTLSNYFTTLRAVLDFAGVDPNPARDPRVRLPRRERETVSPPSATDVAAILSGVPARWRLPLRLLEQTGMRVSEALELEWRDVDVSGCRLRVRGGKTPAARRWAAVPEWLMQELDALCPPDDRTPERRLFPGMTRSAAGSAMRRACTAAGIALYSPHDLRHRYASIKVAEGVPVTQLAEQLGHARKSLTLDTYSHVLLAD
jgi:integrase